MKLLATDLDGTFLQSGGTVSEVNLAALHHARAEGLDVVFATGRPPRWMHEIQEMTQHDGIAICSNGAVVLDLSTWEIIRADVITSEVGLRVCGLLLEIDPGMTFATELLHPEFEFMIDHNYRPRWESPTPPPRASIEEMFATGDVIKLLARPSDDLKLRVDHVLEQVSPTLKGIVDFTHSDIHDLLLEMSALGVNKGAALERHSTALSLEAHQVAAVGDMPNDVEMIQWAGRGAAVDNAHPMIKNVADEHLPTNDEHAVAVFIDRLLLNEPQAS